MNINVFKSELQSDKQLMAFENLYRKHDGYWPGIKAELAEAEDFTSPLINQLEFTHSLAEWSDSNEELISALKQDEQFHSFRDIAANYNKAAFIEKVKVYAPAESDEDKRNFALSLHRKLFNIEPTPLLINMIKDPQVPIFNDAFGANVAAVLEQQPDFNIKTTSIYEILNNEEVLGNIPAEHRTEVIDRLKTLQRLTAVILDPDALPVLYKANLHSAMQISTLPRAQFMEVMGKSQLDNATLMQIHHNAQQVRVRNEQTLISLREAYKGTGIAMIDKSLNRTADLETTETNDNSPVPILEKSLVKHNLSWDLLFGDADICECEECTSVYSAAAYYVELLQYLRNNNLAPDPDPSTNSPIDIKPNPKDISGTPLEKLFERRPDLGCLELTCQNINTLLPYIDLVNEVMENYVAFKRLKAFNVEDEASSELLAEPQHTEYQAYCILKNEVYPFTLPYHQPIDAERIYLNHLETSRYELINTFRKSHNDADAELTLLKDEALERAADAEYLGLTMEEYVILTKDCFDSKALLDKLYNKHHTDEEYRNKIGVKPVYEYYGFDDDFTMLGDDGLTLIKKLFLRRTGIDYFNLVDLLKTEYINPDMPKGKIKTITESLHFSYRFLQNYAKVHGIDKMANDLVKWENMANFLPHNCELFADALSCPETSRNKVEITDKDIINWVKCHFKKVGKMIVIESGRGCIDGEIFKSNEPYAFVENCEIYRDYREQLLHIGSINQKTGEVTFWEENPNPEKLTFINDKGEKGVFLVIEDSIHLVFLEQRDSCDLDSALLQHLDGTPLTVEEYDRIHRFIRLWRKLGWSIHETDQAIAGLGSVRTRDIQPAASELFAGFCSEQNVCNDDCADEECDDCEGESDKSTMEINTRLIHQLVPVKKLLDQANTDFEPLDLEPSELLALWSKINTNGEHSLYRRLFLTYNVLGSGQIFKADDKGNYLTGDAQLLKHISAVMAALQLSADEIQAIMLATGMEDRLTLANLSVLYRYRLMSDILDLNITDLLSVLTLFGDIFHNAHATYKFLADWNKVVKSGFTHQQLNFIINNADDDKKPLSPSQKTILLLTKTLYDGLNLIEQEHQDLINEEQASSVLVRAKASLLFNAGALQTDTLEQIISVLEGTTIYTTQAPKNIDVTLPKGKGHTLKNKLKYDKTLGTLQITGILTKSEEHDYKAVSHDPEWIHALTRIKKQQSKLFKALFSGVFEGEQTKTAAEKAELEKMIKSGDIAIPQDKIPAGEPDPNTAPKKRFAFLAIFLPYLRQQLSHQFIIEMLSDFSDLKPKITDVLVSQVLKLGNPAKPIYHIFESIKESAKPSETVWNGYFIPAVDADYTFIIKESLTKPNLKIDNTVLKFTDGTEEDDELWSEKKTLQAGKLYKLDVEGVEVNSIFFKTPASAITAIPSSALIPDYASKQCEPAFVALKKAALLVSNFELSADEIHFLDLHKADFDNLDFNKLSLNHWFRLEAYVRLRNSLPQTKLNILEFWNWTVNPEAEEKDLITKIADLTGWSIERIAKLTARNHFNIGKLKDYRNEKNLLKIQQAMTVVDKIGVGVDLLFEWAVPVSKFNIRRKVAESIKNTIRSKYNRTDWEQAVKPLHDRLRNNQKEALIAYLLQQKELIAWNVTDADGLFEYFLIDVEMDACMETSRIKQAISSVQLFVQRCFLGLEEEHSGIKPAVLDRPRWEWMQRYRVWEANRKVFLYPENWIESNLRDDKSPFFKELESDLLQKDISKQNVTDALKSYLYKVDEVANLEVIGLYIDGASEERLQIEGAKLHVFSRTRNAPYHLYYRYLALDEMNWYPWERIQIDIPNYDVEDLDTHEVKDNGCYLIPIVWNRRLIIFFPQMTKKTKPKPNFNPSSFAGLGNEKDGLQQATPIEVYEIKMAWSEYRNGKWTQKQISRDAVYSNTIDEYHQIQFFKFVPIVETDKVLINIDAYHDHDGIFRPAFEFNGTALHVGMKKDTEPEPIPIDYFSQDDQEKRRLFSWQIDPSSLKRQYKNVFFYEDELAREQMTLDTISTEFHHPGTQNLLGLMNQGRLELFFNENMSMQAYEFGPFDHDDKYATPDIYHELKGVYSLYNWEMFFHTPVLLADALSKAQQFEEAMKWFHFVFDPVAEGNEDNRFWRFKPFGEVNSKKILDSIFYHLEPNKYDQAISEWRNKPFMPHVVARSRPVAYMKWVVMKYIDNLISWGDYLFRQDTIESINQATQLYVLSGHILGPRPMTIPKRGKIKPQTYLSLLDKWDAFGNALTELELTAPFSNQTIMPTGIVNKELVFANVFGLGSSLYFCIPNNPKLMGYWDTLSDRLYKIRHCQNIEGVFRKLPLFEPPIDPALLVKAAAQGLNIAAVLNDLNGPMPNYRFYYLLQKAVELCNELKSLGSAMLSAIEKKDNETIALIRAKHETVMQNLMMEIKKKQLEEAQKSLEGLQQNRLTLVARMKYYLKLSGLDESLVPSEKSEFSEIPNEIVTVDGDSGLKLIPFEKEDMDKAAAAQGKQLEAALPEKLASIQHIIPNISGNFQPFGMGLSVTFGGENLGAAAQAWAKFLQLDASNLGYASSSAGKKGGFTRAIQERIFQANAAGYELKQIDKQITTQEIRIEIANQEIINQQKAIDNSNEVEEFIKNKYSNEELYNWMRGSLKTLYHQVYNLAFELAKKAEKTYCFERGISSSNFIQSGYFDAGRDGLLAGEQLYVGLKQLETAYQNERGHDYEITKQISLHQINPLAVIQLRETGKCEFPLSEVLFDLDYPGHYKRRIKSVSLSIPCIAGPYTGINASLRLLENKFRNSANAVKSYEENTEGTDDRFSTYIIPIQAIAASFAQNDSGMFELNFKDKRYLPFEGAGVISKWRLELPVIKQFDYHTISDVIIHLKYTACEGGERLKSVATKSVSKRLENLEQELNETGLHLAINMKHDLPNEWVMLKNKGTVNLKIDSSRLPYMAQAFKPKLEKVMFVVKLSGSGGLTVNVGDDVIELAKIAEWDLWQGSSSGNMINLNEPFSLSIASAQLNSLEEMNLILKYSF